MMVNEINKLDSDNTGLPIELPLTYDYTEFKWWGNNLLFHGVKLVNPSKEMVLAIEQGAYELKLVRRK